MLKLLYTALNAKEGEYNRVLLLLGMGFFMGIFMATFQISSETLLVSRLGDYYVSRGLFAAGVLGVIATATFAYLQNKLPYGIFSVMNLVAIFFITTTFYVLFNLLPTRSEPLLAFIQFSMLGPTIAVFLLGFWGLFGRLFDLRQSKRIIGGIDTGQLVAAILTFFTVGLGARFAQTYDLLLVSSISVLGSLIFLITIVKKYNLADPDHIVQQEESVSFKEMISNRYVVLLSIFITLSVFGFLLVENGYLSVLNDQYPKEEEASLRQFLGWFNGSILILSFVFQTFFNDRIIAEYGLRVSLTILPVILGVLTIFVIVIGNVFGFDPSSPKFFLFFLFIALSKLFVSFLRDALENPAFKLYFMTLDNKIRFDIQAKVEGVVVEFAKAVTAGLILLFGLLTFFEIIDYSYIVILVVLGWIYYGGKLYSEYRNRIRIKLESQDISIEEMDVVQESIVKMVENNLSNPKPDTAVFSFKLLEKINPNYVAPSINSLMKHPEEVVNHFAQNKMNAVRGVSVSDKYVVIASSEEILKDRHLINHTDLLELFQSGEISKRRLARLCHSDADQDRQYGAELIGHMESDDSLAYLIELLHDISPNVRMAAISTARRRNNNEVIVGLIDNLATPAYSNLSKSALVMIGTKALPALENAFYKSSQEAQVMLKIVQIMGRIGSSEAMNMLWNKIDFPDKIISSQVLESLSEAGFKASLSQMTRVKYSIESNIGDISWNLGAYLEVPDNRHMKQLRLALEEENDHDITHIYTLLSMLYDPKSIQLIKKNLDSGTSEGITYAIELLDVLLSEDLKQKIIPILDEISVGEKIKKLQAFYPRIHLTPQLVLKFLINRDFTQSNRWTKACAIFQIGRLKVKEFKYDLIANLFNPDKMVQEMAAWGLFQLGEKEFQEHIGRLPKDQAKWLNQVAREELLDPLSSPLIFEKIHFLKSMKVFSGVSGLLLSYVADDTLIYHLTEGESMMLNKEKTDFFIIVRSGELNFYHQGTLTRTLKERNFIGEILDPEEIKGDNHLVAIADSELLILNKDRYYELLSDNILFAQSVMRYMTA